MNAVAEPIAFELPKRPRIKPKDAPPDQRKVCVMPIRALTDDRLTDGAVRVLALLCSYCNRAGLTWVSQKRLAEDMKVSQQAISKQLTKLQQAEYIEVVRKGFRGERSNTLRVIFDPSLSAEDAIAMTSNKEDTRPPSMQDQIDPEGQKRIAQLISKALKQPTKPKGYEMPKSGDTRAVREVKEAMAKAKAKRSKAVENLSTTNASFTTPEVVHESPQKEPPFTTTFTTSEVVHNTREHKEVKDSKVVKDKEVKELKDCLYNLDVVDFDKLIDSGMTPEQVADCAQTLLPIFAAEGLTPNSRTLADSILQLHRDAR